MVRQTFSRVNRFPALLALALLSASSPAHAVFVPAPDVWYGFEAIEESGSDAINQGTAGSAADGFIGSQHLDTNLDYAAGDGPLAPIFGDQSVRVGDPQNQSPTLVDSGWNEASKPTDAFTALMFFRMEETGGPGVSRLFRTAVNSFSNPLPFAGWQLSLKGSIGDAGGPLEVVLTGYDGAGVTDQLFVGGLTNGASFTQMTALTYDGAGNAHVRANQNGVLSGSGSLTGFDFDGQSTVDLLLFGEHPRTPFGVYDDFAAWDHVLSADEIDEIASGGVAAATSAPEPATLWLLVAAILLVAGRRALAQPSSLLAQANRVAIRSRS